MGRWRPLGRRRGARHPLRLALLGTSPERGGVSSPFMGSWRPLGRRRGARHPLRLALLGTSPRAGRSLLPIHGEVAPVRATEGVAPSPPPRFARHLPASGEESSKSAGDGFQVSRGAGCLVA